jgi:hypothetical protein
VLLFLLALVPIMTYRQSEPRSARSFLLRELPGGRHLIGIGTSLILGIARRLTERYDSIVEHAAWRCSSRFWP